MSGFKLPSFDTDEDKKVDEAMAKGETAQVISPPQPAPEQPVQVAPAAPKAPSITELSDEELAAEIVRRRSGRIDAKIAECEQVLAALKAEREALIADPTRVFDATAFTIPTAPVKSTNVNPITGKPKVARPKPGTVRPEDCTCEAGCYLCQTKGITTSLGGGVQVLESNPVPKVKT